MARPRKQAGGVGPARRASGDTDVVVEVDVTVVRYVGTVPANVVLTTVTVAGETVVLQRQSRHKGDGGRTSSQWPARLSSTLRRAGSWRKDE